MNPLHTLTFYSSKIQINTIFSYILRPRRGLSPWSFHTQTLPSFLVSITNAPYIDRLLCLDVFIIIISDKCTNYEAPNYEIFHQSALTSSLLDQATRISCDTTPWGFVGTWGLVTHKVSMLWNVLRRYKHTETWHEAFVSCAVVCSGGTSISKLQSHLQAVPLNAVIAIKQTNFGSKAHSNSATDAASPN